MRNGGLLLQIVVGYFMLTYFLACLRATRHGLMRHDTIRSIYHTFEGFGQDIDGGRVIVSAYRRRLLKAGDGLFEDTRFQRLRARFTGGYIVA